MSLAPVLCYHRIGGVLELGVTRVGRSVFERQMRALAGSGWHTLKLGDFAHQTFQPRSFLLTFDDAYASLADVAFPIVADLGFTAVTFVVTDFVGRENTWDVRYTRRRLRHLDWPTIERWAARGFEFASHTATHPRLTWLSESAASEELAGSREVLTGRLGTSAGRAVAYPFGAVDDRVERLASEAGYELGFGGVLGNGGSRLRVPRVPVYAWDAGRVPFGLRQDAVGAVGRLAAHVANRCSVGTSVMLRLFGSR